MKALLRDLAFLGLFAATVAAVILLIAVHQGRFSVGPDRTIEDSAPDTRALAALPQPVPASIAPEPPATALPQQRLVTHTTPPALELAPAVPFDPSTRGMLGDARVLCLPEVAWLQEQLSAWASEARTPHAAPPATLSAAHAAARRASAFEYQVSPECWNDPESVEARGWGDCADKSLWLARELLHAGYPMVGIRLGVSDDYLPGQPGHAWVVLYHNGGEWIYDPTASPRLTSQDAGPAKRFRVTATVFPRVGAAPAQKPAQPRVAPRARH